MKTHATVRCTKGWAVVETATGLRVGGYYPSRAAAIGAIRKFEPGSTYTGPPIAQVRVPTLGFTGAQDHEWTIINTASGRSLFVNDAAAAERWHNVWKGYDPDAVLVPPRVLKFNQNHEPAGSPAGGQFAAGGGAPDFGAAAERWHATDEEIRQTVLRFMEQRDIKTYGTDRPTARQRALAGEAVAQGADGVATRTMRQSPGTEGNPDYVDIPFPPTEDSINEAIRRDPTNTPLIEAAQKYRRSDHLRLQTRPRPGYAGIPDDESKNLWRMISLAINGPIPVIKEALELQARYGTRIQMMKSDSPEQRIVVGWASVIDNADGTPLVDLQGDIIDEDEMLSAANSFMKSHRTLGDSHRELAGIGHVIESFVVTKTAKQALGLPDSFPRGWLIAAKVTNEGCWQQVKNGTFRGFSIGGSGTREEVA